MSQLHVLLLHAAFPSLPRRPARLRHSYELELHLCITLAPADSPAEDRVLYSWSLQILAFPERGSTLIRFDVCDGRTWFSRRFGQRATNILIYLSHDPGYVCCRPCPRVWTSVLRPRGFAVEGDILSSSFGSGQGTGEIGCGVAFDRWRLRGCSRGNCPVGREARVTGVKGMQRMNSDYCKSRGQLFRLIVCSFSHIPRRSGDTHMAQSPTWPESRQPLENTHCEEVEEDQSAMVSGEDF